MSNPCSLPTERSAACDLSLDHEIDRALCADLERLADGLPGVPDGAALRALSERLLAASERWVDPRWRLTFEPSAAWDARIADSLHAEDLNEALWRYWEERDRGATGQLAYMLRTLFDGRRRAIALEEAELGCANCQSSTIE